MIDLRSDTLTQPTPEMLAAMGSAAVGDDVYAEDPTVNEFEEYVAGLLGHEAGLFCVTGSLSNMLGVWLNVGPGQELLCDVNAHILRAEMGGHALLHGISARTWVTKRGVASVDQVVELIVPDTGPFLVRTAAIALENTHNFAGGSVQPIESIQSLTKLAHDQGLTTHLDGARLWNAHVATGTSLAEYGHCFDTVSVCFSKGLGAPIGSMLCSTKANIARARVQRKRLGAGWRQAGVLAAAARYAVDHHLERLVEDHTNARLLADELARMVPGSVDPASVETNIVIVSTGKRSASEVVTAAATAGVGASAFGAHCIRLVTYLGISADDCRQAAGTLAAILGRP